MGKLPGAIRNFTVRLVKTGQSCGLEWGGSFIHIPDYPHYQFTFGLSIADLKAGKVPPESI